MWYFEAPLPIHTLVMDASSVFAFVVWGMPKLARYAWAMVAVSAVTLGYQFISGAPFPKQPYLLTVLMNGLFAAQCLTLCYFIPRSKKNIMEFHAPEQESYTDLREAG